MATIFSSSLRNLEVTGESGMKMLFTELSMLLRGKKKKRKKGGVFLQDSSRHSNGDQTKEKEDDLYQMLSFPQALLGWSN